jgi:hypothetical protein
VDASQGAIWFFGDLSDPWVDSIADALPPSHGVSRIDCSSEPPSRPASADSLPRLIVMHRQRLVPSDAQWLQKWREPTGSPASPALILCVGPYIRYEELERYSGLVDLVLSEATAAEVLPRHVARLLEGRQGRAPRPESSVFRLLVASSNAELSRAVAEACAAAGYRAEQVEDQAVGAQFSIRNESQVAAESVLTIWDVPVLEAWSERLERHALHVGPLIALLGFADRRAVSLARSNGAFACLELPLNLDDLVDAIDRFARAISLEPPTLPARVEPAHHLPPRTRRRDQDKVHTHAKPRWPESGRPPTIE